MTKICLISLIFIFIACGNSRNNPLEEQIEPAKPTGVDVQLLPNAVGLTWKPLAHTSTYNVFRKPGAQQDGLIGTSSVARFEDTAVINGTTYRYWVRGVGKGAESGSGLLGPKSDPLSVVFYKPQLELVGNPDKKLDFGTGKMTLTVTFKNRGGGLIHWEISNEIPWAQFTPQKGSVGKEPFSIRAQVDRRECEPRSYEATATVKGNLGAPIALTVRMQIPNKPLLSVEPQNISLCPGEGKDIQIGNTGTGTVVWRIAGSANWLDVTPRDGTVACGEAISVRLQASETDVSPGSESVDVRISGASMEKSIVVTRHAPEPEVEMRPDLVELLESNNWTVTLTLTNLSECNLPWEANSTRTWLVMEPKMGRLSPNTSQGIQIRGTKVETLDAGVHEAQIVFTLTGRQRKVDVILSRTGTLRGRFVNIFTQQGIPGVTINTDVGTSSTDNRGRFEVPYEQEGSFRWTASHPNFLSSEGSMTTRRAVGEVGTIALIPIPKPAGEVDANFGFDTPWSIALSDDERQACIVNQDGDFVSIVDTGINKVVETIEVGKKPFGAVYADGELFVGSWDNTVSIINPLRRELITTMEVLGLPAYLAACRGTLYVTLQDNIAGNQVAVLDIATRRVERRIPVGRCPTRRCGGCILPLAVRGESRWGQSFTS